jgi:MoaA/NifB/PqqE/SkfB family radical SAM enzyme
MVSSATANCLFRLPPTGGRVLWQLTNICNYTCPYCIFASGPRKIPGELSYYEICRTLDGLKTAGFSAIKFTGGEPFVRQDIMHILTAAHVRGFTLDVSTNASLVKSEHIPGLEGIPFEQIHISLDGPNREVHERARGAGSFAPTMRGLSFLLKTGSSIRVGCVLFRDNQFLIQSMVESCVKLGVNRLAFSLLEPAGRISGDRSWCVTRSLTEMGNEIHYLQAKYPSLQIQQNFQSDCSVSNPCSSDALRCPGGTRFLVIDNVGRISPCTWAPYSREAEAAGTFRSQGTLKTNTVGELLASEPLKRYQELISIGGTKGLAGCPRHWSKSNAQSECL